MYEKLKREIIIFSNMQTLTYIYKKHEKNEKTNESKYKLISKTSETEAKEMEV